MNAKSVLYNTRNTPLTAQHQYIPPAALCPLWGIKTQEQHQHQHRKPVETWEGPHRPAVSCGDQAQGHSYDLQVGEQRGQEQDSNGQAATGCVGRLQITTDIIKMLDLSNHSPAL